MLSRDEDTAKHNVDVKVFVAHHFIVNSSHGSSSSLFIMLFPLLCGVYS